MMQVTVCTLRVGRAWPRAWLAHNEPIDKLINQSTRRYARHACDHLMRLTLGILGLVVKRPMVVAAEATQTR